MSTKINDQRQDIRMPMKQDGIDTVTQSDNKMYDTKVYSDQQRKDFYSLHINDNRNINVIGGKFDNHDNK